jgi:uncharacterized protein (TIGR03083 family)
VDVADHVDQLEEHGRQLAHAARTAGLDAAVPSCPEWDVRQLVRHTGMVHRWAGAHVRGRTELWRASDEEIVGTWPRDVDLVDWFVDGHRTLVEDLRAAPADLECATFLPAPSPLAMWARRQAHETAIHRVDAELAAGRFPAFSPAFAADGVDELLTVFIVRKGGRLLADPARTLRVRSDDAPGDWLVHIGPDEVHTSAVGDGDGDCTVSGAASDLYLMAWNRRSPDGLTVTGDADVLSLFRDNVHIRWS